MFHFLFLYTCMTFFLSVFFWSKVFISGVELFVLFLVQGSGCSDVNVSSRVSPVLSPLCHDFKIKAREKFDSSLQADV